MHPINTTHTQYTAKTKRAALILKFIGVCAVAALAVQPTPSGAQSNVSATNSSVAYTNSYLDDVALSLIPVVCRVEV